MMRYRKINVTDLVLGLRWVARIWSVLSVVLLFLFFIGEGLQLGKVTPQEWLGLLFFPIGITVGLMIAWWKEGWGGAITVVSFIGFYLVYGLLLRGSFPKGWAFPIFAAPGLLYLVVWWTSRQVGKTATP
jgi:hypothetical protein